MLFFMNKLLVFIRVIKYGKDQTRLPIKFDTSLGFFSCSNWTRSSSRRSTKSKRVNLKKCMIILGLSLHYVIYVILILVD